MNDFRRLRAPAGDGDRLIVPTMAEVPALIEANRNRFDSSPVRIDGRRLADVRRAARQELAPHADPSKPLLLTGHQPELCHPGVWLKSFEIDRLAGSLGGNALNLVVDTDDIKSTSIRVPRFSHDPALVRAEMIAFDTGPTETPYESRTIQDHDLFRSFGERAGIDPDLWSVAVGSEGRIAERFVAMRTHREASWGCALPNLWVSRISRSEAFGAFARHLLADLPRFAAVHNQAVQRYRRAARLRSRTHPVPELQPGEAPFWVVQDGRRRAATPASGIGSLRPRALTLTLFARLVLGDWFVHGLGGGKYDAVTDDITREFFGIEPPAFQVVTGTLRLPFPVFDDADPTTIIHRLRDVAQNPQRYLEDDESHIRAMVRQLNERIAETPPTKTGRKERRETINRLKGMLRSRTVATGDRLADERDDRGRRTQANAILTRRDYAWPLFPSELLRPFFSVSLPGPPGST
jgi:hypothetical protein